jgi:hypothetical protein
MEKQSLVASTTVAHSKGDLSVHMELTISLPWLGTLICHPVLFEVHSVFSGLPVAWSPTNPCRVSANIQPRYWYSQPVARRFDERRSSTATVQRPRSTARNDFLCQPEMVSWELEFQLERYQGRSLRRARWRRCFNSCIEVEEIVS